MFSILEVAILSMILSGKAEPFFCRLREEGGTVCSNGLSAALLADDTLRFTNFTEVSKDPDGNYRFSNGITAWHSAAGGIRFSTGISVRRRSYNTFDATNGLVCHLGSQDIAACDRQ
ncbi:hypothetical protein [Ferrovibrio sp.]|uniref:hypothetical protein n=1 Tax=Ferrovibrio sp. TaxID=1917215 RepID=UPI003D2658BF